MATTCNNRLFQAIAPESFSKDRQMQNPTITAPATVSALEKVPHAAKRMGISTCQAYREIKAGRLGPLVKLGERASALPSTCR
jgi:predicted DNA-binding transcriptional regulator AlpA